MLGEMMLGEHGRGVQAITGYKPKKHLMAVEN
jgi:hypothetical protein